MRDHLGRGVRRAAVRQPHGDRDAHRRPAAAGVPERLHARSAIRHRGGTGRFPQVSGLKVDRSTATARRRSSTAIWKAPDGPAGPLTPIGPTDTVRLVTNDFMFTGGDGYTVFPSATNVLQTGDLLLDIVIAVVQAGSPIGPVVDGRIVKT